MSNQANAAQWLSAIGTVGAVLIALFQNFFMQWWRRPRLTASIRLEPPDCHAIPVTYRDAQGRSFGRAPSYHFRLWVENEGRGAAEHVQVFAARLQRHGPEGAIEEVAAFLPMNLRWAHSGDVYARRLSPGMGQNCSLGHIVRADPVLFDLDLEVSPNSDVQRLSAGRSRLALWIAAANARPITVLLDISIEGRWFDAQDEMFEHGIGIQMVPDVPNRPAREGRT